MRHMLSVAFSEEIIARPKIMVAAMSWVKKLGRDQGNWLEFTSALQYASDTLETPEGLLVRGQWRPTVGARPANYGFNFFIGVDRVYAIDVQPAARHKNTFGVGRPLHGQLISGTHEHTWSSDGHGYAEPVTVLDIEGAWGMFAKRANIIGAEFVLPEDARQGSLL